MNNFDYSATAIRSSLEKAGVRQGDILLCHVSLGRLGVAEEGNDIRVLSDILLKVLSESVGKQGTILVPTYTYSIGKNELFDPANTPSTIGPFTEYARCFPGSVRSVEPMLAMSGLGAQAEELLTDLPPTSFGEGSVYSRLVQKKAKVCCIGLGIHWATFRHHIEQMTGIPFRFSKMFSGTISQQGRETPVAWEYFAAYKIPNCQADGRRMQNLLESKGLISKQPLGRASISCIGADTYYAAGKELITTDPWLTAKGPPCEITSESK